MKQPSLDILLSKVDSKYTLVLAAAKRARNLMEEPEFEANHPGEKPVSIAFEEIAKGKYHFELTTEGIK
ncbi:DNA-directed RNA polymerase subunit omega [Desulfitobacterium dichloroeliminans LMG P-21439]|uniref:DNA-directed RNA polymerase subunit omega n=1 Tax=Desulfitobacterium dichloroeliminans (strain LMG P-21439 / DCA1) TaxID=871963 RepID=L0FAC3_DESDL|nr:DNA-directed RNA polymerase subunit omega [Desulfitobacterium dichloroeliminans]AGA70162.1 DNA-directed RNA polymerase subunit omega [Desulfitobacterium dichloroeliminans LMG P-21439]